MKTWQLRNTGLTGSPIGFRRMGMSINYGKHEECWPHEAPLAHCGVSDGAMRACAGSSA